MVQYESNREREAYELFNAIELFNNDFTLVRNKDACNIYKYLVDKDIRLVSGEDESFFIDRSLSERLFVEGYNDNGDLEMYLETSYEDDKYDFDFFDVPIDEFIRLASGNKDINITDEMRTIMSYKNNQCIDEFFDAGMFSNNYKKLLSILGIS